LIFLPHAEKPIIAEQKMHGLSLRYLVVNGDDFGQSLGINRGIIQAYEQGILTSTSLMVRWPFAEDAAAYARKEPALAVGLHIDLGEWFYDGEKWLPRYQVVDSGNREKVLEEIDRQMSCFESLLGKPPTHLDSHQHVHRNEPVSSIMLEISEELKMPLRHFTPGVTYLGSFYGQDEQGISIKENVGITALRNILNNLPTGLFEMACHPAAITDFDSMYKSERLYELSTLCHSSIREAINEYGVQLINMSRVRELYSDGSLGQYYRVC
jgi:predicted glycoside hydrolase/deacetylase ChbG (UPF0249 family)